MTWLRTVCPARGTICQRLASTATPSSIAARIEPSSNSVRLARTIRGALKSGTPFAIASTPVSALHPAENALRTSRMLTGSKPRVASSKGPGAGGCGGVRGQRMDQADAEYGQQAHDEHQRWQQECPGRVSETAQVQESDQGEDAQANRHPVRDQAGEGGGQGPAPGRYGHGDGQRVVNDQGGGCEQAGRRPEVVEGHGIRATATRVGFDDLPVR